MPFTRDDDKVSEQQEIAGGETSSQAAQVFGATDNTTFFEAQNSFNLITNSPTTAHRYWRPA